MVNPHPKEGYLVGGVNSEMTWLSYFAARCPKPYAFGQLDNYPGDTVAEKDCHARIEWARAMLHVLWPVSVQNSGADK